MLEEGLIGPDAAELHANGASFLLDSMQSRKSAGRASPVAAVPAGLEPEEHYEAGLRANSPLSAEPEVPADLRWAIQMNCTMKSGIDSWRCTQFRLLEELCSSQSGQLANKLNGMRTPPSIACSSHVHLDRLSFIIQAIRWPDRSLVEDVTTGFRPLGQQPVIGIYREKISNAVMSVDELLVQNAA